METTAFFEKKISISPSNLNQIKTTPIAIILLKKAKEMTENKCSEQGFIVPGSVKLLSHSMGYFESARFTGDVNYYTKLECKVIYPADGIKVTGRVIRKNKMGLYVNYDNAIRIQIPRDLHLGNQEYDAVEVGMDVQVELKRSKFAINDTYILASGMYISSSQVNKSNEENKSNDVNNNISPNMDDISDDDDEDEDDEKAELQPYNVTDEPVEPVESDEYDESSEAAKAAEPAEISEPVEQTMDEDK